MAQYDAASVVVYQAYNPAIGRFAAQNGYFGGKFSYERMSWCKPNFLWMMYRSGWGTKPDQEVTLAIRVQRAFFDRLLGQAVASNYDSHVYPNKGDWSKAVAASDVRLQWDPDHAPNGTPLPRRALQLGLRGLALRKYGRDAIVSIEDISAFVAQQRNQIGQPAYGALQTLAEQRYIPADAALAVRLRLSA